MPPFFAYSSTHYDLGYIFRSIIMIEPWISILLIVKVYFDILYPQAKSIVWWSGFGFMSAMLTFSAQDSSYQLIVHIEAKNLVVGIGWIWLFKEGRTDVIVLLRHLRINFRIENILVFLFLCREDIWDTRNLEACG